MKDWKSASKVATYILPYIENVVAKKQLQISH